jgi:hypothetical protein
VRKNGCHELTAVLLKSSGRESIGLLLGRNPLGRQGTAEVADTQFRNKSQPNTEDPDIIVETCFLRVWKVATLRQRRKWMFLIVQVPDVSSDGILSVCHQVCPLPALSRESSWGHSKRSLRELRTGVTTRECSGLVHSGPHRQAAIGAGSDLACQRAL